MPVVLRKVNDYWVLVGECWVYGIMKGEALPIINSPADKEGSLDVDIYLFEDFELH